MQILRDFWQGGILSAVAKPARLGVHWERRERRRSTKSDEGAGMSVDREQVETFKKGSKTYFNSSLFFPPEVRDRVFTLYAFVRTADDFVDAIPQKADDFRAFRAAYRDSAEGRPAGNRIIDSYVELAKAFRFDSAWTEAFFDSMEADLFKKDYDSLEETLKYIYGSAEVIGLFMARIMELDEVSHPSAKMLGRAMQYINFIRDFAEDRNLGRRYLPLNGADPRLAEEAFAREHPDLFAAFLRSHLELYQSWQREAVAGYRFMPHRYRIPVASAGDMYWWTAEQIKKNPLVVFERQIKPSRSRVWFAVFKNALGGC